MKNRKELYDDIKNKTAQVIAIQEYIYPATKKCQLGTYAKQKVNLSVSSIGKGGEQLQQNAGLISATS